MLVTDASVLVPALAADSNVGRAARTRLHGTSAVAPEVVDLECLSAFRGLVLARKLAPRHAVLAIIELGGMGLERFSHAPLLGRIWELRENVSPYDAAYVALAESLGATLLTADARLTRAPGIRCHVEVLTA